MNEDLQKLSTALAGTAAALAPSLVAVHSDKSLCSGFAWRDGLIVTSDEGVADEGEVAVTLPGGQRAAAQIAGRDPGTAVVLLRTAANLVPAKLATAVPQTGALALGIGASGGAPLASLGIVAASGPAWRSMRGGAIDARIDLDMRLRRSAEGGLAVDAAGEPFGMVVHGPRRRVLVIPSATIERVAAQLAEAGRIARGYLGLGLQPVEVSDANGTREGTGAMVMSVDPRGPGAAAGIHQGDVLVAWDGQPIGRLQPLLRSLGPDSVGRAVALELRRGGQTHQATLRIGERPAA